MKTLTLVILAIIFGPLNGQAGPVQKTIYESDSRVEVDEHPDRLLRDYADSVAGMVRDYRLLDEPSDDYQSFADFSRELVSVLGKDFIQENPNLLSDAYSNYLSGEQQGRGEGNSSHHSHDKDFYYFNKNRTLKRNMRVCKSERFAEQPVLSQCTGFLVAPDLLLTAGHCVSSKFQCENFRWVFGYKKGVMKLPRRDVYRCEKIVSSELTDSIFSTRDYSLIKLDRKVKGRRPLPVRVNGYVDKDEQLAVIGHPSGLPMKIADNAWVTKRRVNFFYSNLDTFSGNSGSPVINTRTGIVEGLLIQGASDFTSTPEGCMVSRLRSSDDDEEEKVFRLPRVDDLEDFVKGEKSY